MIFLMSHQSHILFASSNNDNIDPPRLLIYETATLLSDLIQICIIYYFPYSDINFEVQI